MDETTLRTPKSKLPVLIGIVLALLVVAVGWLYWDRFSEDDTVATTTGNFADCVAAGNPVMESYPEQCNDGTKTYTNPDQAAGFVEPVSSTSGKELYDVTFPGNWGEIARITSADDYRIGGQKQPNGSTVFNDVDGSGGDGSSVFAIVVGDSFAEPRGTSEPYTLVNGKENPIEGTKHTYYYESDEKVGIGIQRFRGDVDYEYVFQIADGKELHVFYSVYGIDPSNHLAEVEAIIDSIFVR